MPFDICAISESKENHSFAIRRTVFESERIIRIMKSINSPATNVTSFVSWTEAPQHLPEIKVVEPSASIEPPQPDLEIRSLGKIMTRDVEE